jgi:hypothetical protein
MTTSDTTPTVVLVHGAFVDASHAVPATHPGDVAAVIVRAVKVVT